MTSISKEAETHLNSLEKEALINQITDRANTSQENRRTEAIAATNNWEHFKELAENFKPSGKAAMEQQTQTHFEKRQAEENDKLSKIDSEIAELQAQEAQLTKALAQDEAIKKGADKSQSDTLAQAVTEEQLKALNKMLDDDRPKEAHPTGVLTHGLEVFCALLRNREEANKIDVQLYLANFQKLQYKLANIEATTLDLVNVDIAIDKFAKMKQEYSSDEVARDYVSFTEWGTAYANFAQKVLKAEDTKKNLKETQAAIAKKTKEQNAQQGVTEMFNNPKHITTLSNQGDGSNKLSGVQVALAELRDQARANAQSAQQVNHDYGNSYFSKLQEMRKAAQVPAALAPTTAVRKTRKSTFTVSVGAEGQASAAGNAE